MSQGQIPGVFAPLIGQIAFIDRAVFSIWTPDAPITDCLLGARNSASLSGGRFYARSVSGRWKESNNVVQIAYGKASRFKTVPPARLSVHSEQVPLSGAQVALLCRELFPHRIRIQPSVAELTCDLDSVSIHALIRQALHGCHRTKFMEDTAGRKTYYIGSRQSAWQAKFYTKTPDIIRVEFTLYRPFLRRKEIDTPAEVWNLHSLDLDELLSFRRISRSRLEGQTASWSPIWKEMLSTWESYHSLADLRRLLLQNGIKPEYVLRHSKVHDGVQRMINNLWW